MNKRRYNYLKQHRLWAVSGLVVIVTLSLPFVITPRIHAPAGLTTIPTSMTEPLQAPTAPVPATPKAAFSYPQHADIIATMFYVGEGANDENDYISNQPSAWDEQWTAHFGGIDSPDHRNGWLPAGFTPKQNPFYIALPYNDFDGNDHQKTSAKAVYWYQPAGQTQLKNAWVEICHANACAYGQWEDVGPYGEDDVSYVFGPNRPANRRDAKAGIDLSPALNDYLHIDGQSSVNWRFMPADQVPNGPWKKIVTG